MTVEDFKPIRGNFKILIVEDNEINLLYFSMIIKALCPDAAVFKATTGKIALQYISESELDVVFLDLFLPDMEGFEIIKFIRSAPNKGKDNLPVIALTSLSSAEDKQNVYDSGMNAFLSKPASKESIYFYLNKYLLKASTSENFDVVEENKIVKRHFCKEELFDKIGSDKDFFNSLLQHFIDIYNKNIKSIIDAKNNRDFESIFSMLHHIKGGAASLCFERMTAIISKFQLIDFKDDVLFNKMISEINSEYAYLIEFFNKESNIFD